MSQKTVQNCFCQNFVKVPPILIIFVRKMAKRLKLCEVYSFSTLPNSHHHTTMFLHHIPLEYIETRYILVVFNRHQNTAADTVGMMDVWGTILVGVGANPRNLNSLLLHDTA